MLKRLPPEPTEPGVVASSVYAGGKRIADISIDEVGAWLERPDHFVWIGLFEPSLELLQRVQEQLHLHPLAIEDAGNAHEQPKLEQYGEALFIVARTAQMLAGRITFGETHFFMWFRFGTEHRRPTQRFASDASLVRRFSLTVSTTSSTRFSILSSTTMHRYWTRSTER
jgi:Mg2+ and Co2+ transporter CorA